MTNVGMALLGGRARQVFLGLALGAGGLAGATHAATPMSSRDGFIRSCEAQMMMSAPQCGCMADKAETDLDALSIAYLSLGATDVRNTAATAKAMTPKELAAVDKFMRTAPGLCSGAK